MIPLHSCMNSSETGPTPDPAPDGCGPENRFSFRNNMFYLAYSIIMVYATADCTIVIIQGDKKIRCSKMENYKLVLPEHLNHYGYLFGGHLLKWVDEVAWIAASLDYPGCNFVTIGMDRVEFKKSVRQGAVLRLEVNKAREGRTSVQYKVEVYRRDIKIGEDEQIFTTNTTFVCLDSRGKKCSLYK